MRWVYVLRCENDYYYVGQTTRLFRRFWEHFQGNGGVNTSTYEPQEIVAIYKVDKIGKFLDYAENVQRNIFDLGNIYFGRNTLINFNTEEYGYDDRQIENFIVEKMMIDNPGCWEKIKGGKYTRFDCSYNFPQSYLSSFLPNCDCGVPCDINYNQDDDYLYFRCAKKNIWEEMREEFDIDEACVFFKKYTKDIVFKKEYNIRMDKIRKLTSRSSWLSNLLGNNFEKCIGGCGKDFDSDNTIRYDRGAINLCFDCFLDKNLELKKRYGTAYLLEDY